MKVQPARRRATQARSRATVDNILAAAARMIAERGADAVTMTEIARESGVVIGSLYQYFGDKSEILRALLERHNAEVDEMVVLSLDGVRDLDDLVERVAVTYARYFELHQKDPMFQGIWSAVQTDADLQALDVEDTLAKAAHLHRAALPLYRKVDSDALMATCAMIMHLSLAAARFATAIPEPLKGLSLGIYQGMSRAALLALEERP
jgi:AcrR family transcriptional regulator